MNIRNREIAEGRVLHGKLPNCLIIGAAKAGTTSLHFYMGQHPEIFMSPLKEPNYFAYEGGETRTFGGRRPNNRFPVRTIGDYLELFKNALNERVIGEASPIYLESPVAARRIKDIIPSAKLLAVLRNPADRAFSDYMMAFNDGDETRDIEDAMQYDSHYVQVGFYFEKLRRYYDLFPHEQIKVCLFEDLSRNALLVVQDIFRYLNVDPTFRPNIELKHNVGAFPKSKLLAVMNGKFRHNETLLSLMPDWLLNMARSLKRANSGSKIEFPVELRKKLIGIYREDMLRVEDLIKRDTWEWMNVECPTTTTLPNSV